MDLNIFVREQPDNDVSWIDKFSKSDITFLDNADYEQFKKDLANYLFELRYGRQNLLDDIEAGCKEEFTANYEIVFETLIGGLDQSGVDPQWFRTRSEKAEPVMSLVPL